MSDTAPTPPRFHRHMLEALVCPVSQGRLDYHAQAPQLISTSAKLASPIRDGIPLMLFDEARKLDD